ncbi:MAG: PD-(D/E)XK nuclease family protein [Planctomycetaceae bacterium]|jgi:S-DNA-T family DNA segregation ATPase FtsK/SpoIIIE|nr:PD-(D/E)XK nuclease family protein [Planctomycetaceae bacterium]
MDYQVTASDIPLAIRCSQRCVRTPGADPHARRTGPEGNDVFYGTLFHKEVVVPFQQDAADRTAQSSRRKKLAAILSVKTATDEEFADRLSGFFREEYLFPFFRNRGKEITEWQFSAITSVADQWLRQWSQSLYQIFCRVKEREISVEPLLNAVFWPPEKKMTAVHTFPDGKKMQITGQWDTILCGPDGKDAEIIDFKRRKASNPQEDLMPIALYAWLMKQTAEVEARGLVLYFEEPDGKKKSHPCSMADVGKVIKQLPALFQQVRDIMDRCAPVLKTLDDRESPFCETCKRKTNSRKEDPPDNREAEEALHRLVKVLNDLKVPVLPEGYFCGPRFMSLHVQPDVSAGTTVSKIINRVEDLRVHMELNVAPLIKPGPGYVRVDIPRKKFQTLTLGGLLEMPREMPDSTAAFPLGVRIDGLPYWVDLSSPATPGILIGGTTGSGKSILLQSIVMALTITAPKEAVRFTLVDPKRVTFASFENFPTLYGHVIMENEETLDRLSVLVEEMEQRYRLFAKEKVDSLEKYNQRHTELLLPRDVVVIDEYADMISEKKTKEHLERFIKRIGQKGRASGLHLILATQQPTVKVVDSVIKSNLPLRIAMKVLSGTNSKVILDEVGAECLLGNGDMLAGGSIPTVRLQGAYVTGSDLTRVQQKYV